MLKIEAEALSSGRAAPQTHAGCAGLRRCLVRGCAVFSAALCAAPALYRALCRAESTRVPAHEISQELSERHHMTDFGLAPHTLHLSGFDCRGHNSHVDYANGEYSFGGVTGEGRAFFVQDPDRFQQNSETRILYYDRECDGKHGGGNNMYGAWKLAYDTKEHFDFERSEMMRVDGECWGFAEVVVDTGVHGKPWYFDAEPGPAPPTKAHWQVWCGDTVKHKVQAITVHFREAANIHGEWQFLYSAMPDEKVTMKHGKKETTSNNRKWDTQGKDSIDVGGDVSFSYELFFGASVQGKTSREVSSSLASSWSHETEYSTEVVREFKLPKDSGSAFYQWVLTATTPDQEAMDVLTQSFAFTPDAAHPPRCYPGGSTDGYRYQKCNPGWQLS